MYRLCHFRPSLSYPTIPTRRAYALSLFPTSTRRTPESNRAGKYKQIREILEPLPDRRFDTSTIRVPYVTGFGTAYVDAYEQVRYGL